MWFSFDCENGIAFHDTEAEAKARAEESFDQARDFADEGWDENVTDICWGEVRGKVNEVPGSLRSPKPEDRTDFDLIIDYALTDIDNAELHSSECSEAERR